jgi:hypothetical protein
MPLHWSSRIVANPEVERSIVAGGCRSRDDQSLIAPAIDTVVSSAFRTKGQALR